MNSSIEGLFDLIFQVNHSVIEPELFRLRVHRAEEFIHNKANNLTEFGLGIFLGAIVILKKSPLKE